MGMVDYNKKRSKLRLLAGERVHWIENSDRADYIRRVVLSCPMWVTNEELQALKAKALEKTVETGELHVLDHIIPLNHPRVCGLTVPWNLQIIHWRANLSKSNRWCEDQLELFPEDTDDTGRTGPHPAEVRTVPGPDPQPDRGARPALAAVAGLPA